MTNQIDRISLDYALELFTSLSEQDQQAILALAAALASRQ